MPRDATEALALLVADVYEVAGALRRSGEELAGAVEQSQARWQLLSVVSEGDWTVPAIARRLGVSRQAVQRVADVLAAEGHLRFVVNPAHRRSPHVVPTRSGRAALSRITASSEGWRTRVADGLSATEIAQARTVLRKVLARVHAVSNEPAV